MNRQLLVGSVFGILLVLAAAFILSFHSSPTSYGATAFTSGQVQNSPFIFSSGLSAGSAQQLIIDGSGNLTTIGTLTVGSGSGVTQQFVTGSCVNTASTTLFAVLNPFNATSTATLISMTEGGNATSTTIQVGTSSRPAWNTTGDISASLINATSTPSSTVEWLESGSQQSNLGFLPAGTASQFRVVVPPNVYVGAYATGTANGVQTGMTLGEPTCSYELLFTK